MFNQIFSWLKRHNDVPSIFAAGYTRWRNEDGSRGGLVSKMAYVDPSAYIDESTHVDAGVEIGKNCRIYDSQIAVMAKISDDCTITQARICSGAIIAVGSTIHSEAVVGLEAKIHANVTIGPKSVIGNYTEVGSGTMVGTECWVGQSVFIGNNVILDYGVNIGGEALISASVTIGQECKIGKGLVIGPFSYIERDCTVDIPVPSFLRIPDFTELREEYKDSHLVSLQAPGSEYGETILLAIPAKNGQDVGVFYDDQLSIPEKTIADVKDRFGDDMSVICDTIVKHWDAAVNYQRDRGS